MASRIHVAQESSLDSFWFRSVPHLKDALTGSIFGVFNRFVTLPARFYYCVNPLPKFKGDIQSELTHKRVEENLDPLWGNGFNPPPKENVHYIIDRVNELAKKMGMHEKIRIIPSLESPGALGSKFSKEIVVCVTRELAYRSKEEIDFVLSHELTHVNHNHFLIETGIKASILTFEILGAVFVSPLTIPLIEFFASPLENFCHRAREMDADQTALKILNTNTGAVSYFSNKIQHFQAMRAAASSCSPEERKKREQYISVSGDNRLDIIHPPFSARLANAEFFQARV